MTREVVVITGASAGVGRATAQRFAEAGACIGLIARGPDRLDSARRDVESRGGLAITLPLDVSDAAAVDAAAGAVERTFGPIDVWVNNAMTSVFSPVHEMLAEEYRRVTEVNYLGYVHGTLAALQRMRPRDRGVIVQVGSALPHRSIPLQSAYCATKHAIKGFNESLITELKHDRSRVRAVMVQLPAMNTPQFEWVRSRLPNQPQPVPPIFQPEVGAEAVFYAAHHDVGAELLVGGPTLEAVMGERLAPWYLDQRLARTGYATQQTGEPMVPRDDNLWQPVSGTWGAHGRFDDRAHTHSAELWARMHRNWLAVGAAGALGVALGMFGPSRAGKRHGR